MREARSGQRVLLVSTDQAHSLGDVLGVHDARLAAVEAAQNNPVALLMSGPAGGVTGSPGETVC